MALSATVRLYIAVAVGSALGAVARFLCSFGLLAAFGPAFPWGTLAVNVIGSFIIGLYFTLTEPDGRLFASPATRQFVMAGLCGGFTTFSIFSLETLWLFERGSPSLGVAYVLTSLMLWLAAVRVGSWSGQQLNRLKGTK